MEEMENITASELAGFGVGTLLLCATIVAPRIDAFISASQRRSLSLSCFPHFYSESLTHPIFCVNSDLGYIGMHNYVSGVLLKFVFLMI